jgi:ketosteroid isomerase-like protein
MADNELLRELNNDIWHAFPRVYGDADAFLALYAPDLIRAGGPTSKVQGYAEFAEITRQWFADLADRGSTVDIEFRFTERIADADLASERGVFRMTARRATGGEKVFHGRFHTFSRRIDGRWRIAVDYDSDENGTVTADAFESAAPADDIG